MSDRFQAVLAEIAAAIGAKKIRSGERAMKFGRGEDLDEFTLLIRKGFYTLGEHSGRPVNLDFRASGEIEIDVNTSDRARFRIQRNGFLARLTSFFGRAVKTGDDDFDRAYLVQEEGGVPLDDIVADPGFATAVRSIEPFQQLVAKDRILECVFVYDRETLTAEDVMRRLDAASDLATLLESAS